MNNPKRFEVYYCPTSCCIKLEADGPTKAWCRTRGLRERNLLLAVTEAVSALGLGRTYVGSRACWQPPPGADEVSLEHIVFHFRRLLHEAFPNENFEVSQGTA